MKGLTIEVPLDQDVIVSLLHSYLYKNFSEVSIEYFLDKEHNTLEEVYKDIGKTVLNEIINQLLAEKLNEKDERN